MKLLQKDMLVQSAVNCGLPHVLLTLRRVLRLEGVEIELLLLPSRRFCKLFLQLLHPNAFGFGGPVRPVLLRQEWRLRRMRSQGASHRVQLRRLHGAIIPNLVIGHSFELNIITHITVQNRLAWQVLAIRSGA